MKTYSLTLIMTQPLTSFSEEMISWKDPPDACHLFFVHRGVSLVDREWPWLPPGHRGYCAVDHEKYFGPRPGPSLVAGGLATLGMLLRRSDAMLCLPHGPCLLKRQPVTSGVVVALDAEPGKAREGLRVAVGLAGCDVPIEIRLPVGRSWPTIEDLGRIRHDAREFVEVMTALKICCKDQEFNPSKEAGSMGLICL
ncbi:MAG: hypothetical protein HQL76_08090 [Magnetococcales bacterium]|nr:hypothetical protein [Magnetococcales bacterium]